MATNDSASNVTLDDLIDHAYQLHVPVIAFDVILSIIGTLGNFLVIYVFGFRFKKTATTNYFILLLSVFDMITCIIGLPFDAHLLTEPYRFDNPIMCKLMRFIPGWSTLTSAGVLTVISFDRFRKICRPLKRQMSTLHAKIACACAIILGLLMSWPVLMIYGTRVRDLRVNGLTGLECSTTEDMRKTIYPTLFNGTLFASFFITLIIMTVIYIMIGRQILRHQKFKNSDYGNRLNRRRVSENEASFDQKSCHSTSSGILRRPSLKREASINTGSKKDMRATIKTTGMLFVITIGFVLSFVPHLSLMIARGVNRHLTRDFSFVERVFYLIAIRSYFVNGAVNPVVYGYFNARFRRECGRLLKGMFLCKGFDSIRRQRIDS